MTQNHTLRPLLIGGAAFAVALLSACNASQTAITHVDLATPKSSDIELYVTDVHVVPHKNLSGTTYSYAFKYNPDDYKNPFSLRVDGHADDLSLWEPTLRSVVKEDGTPAVIERIKVPRDEGVKAGAQ